MVNCTQKLLLFEFFSISIILFFTTTDSFADNQTSTKELLSNAIQLINSGNHEDAIIYLDKILQLEPNNVNALNLKAVAIGKVGKYDEAISILNQVLQIEPGNLSALSNKGVVLLKLQKYQEAISYFDKVLQIDSKNVAAQKNKELAYKTIGLVSTKGSKYNCNLEIEIRNSSGQLVGYLESENTSYLNFILTDDYLEKQNDKLTITKDEKKYQVIKLSTQLLSDGDFFIGETRLVAKDMDYPVVIFSTQHPGYTIDKGDIVTATWTITRLLQ